MKKIKATMFYPVQSTESRTIEIDVPEDRDPEEWIENEKLNILERELPDINDVSYLVDLGLIGLENIR